MSLHRISVLVPLELDIEQSTEDNFECVIILPNNLKYAAMIRSSVSLFLIKFISDSDHEKPKYCKLFRV